MFPSLGLTHLDKGIDVEHERLSSANYELVDASNGMGSVKQQQHRTLLHTKAVSLQVFYIFGRLHLTVWGIGGGKGTTANFWRCVVPNFWAAVVEELQEFGDHDVKGSVKDVAVQDFRWILTYFLQGPKSTLKEENYRNYVAGMLQHKMHNRNIAAW